MNPNKTRREWRLDFINREQATSFLNNAKWKAICAFLDSFHLPFNAKLLGSKENRNELTFMLPHFQNDCIEFGSMGVVPFSDVEWMDVHFADRSDGAEIERAIAEKFQKLHIVYSKIDGFFRVYGYCVPSSHTPPDALKN